MKLCLWIIALLFVVIGTNTQDLDLFDALGDDPTVAPKLPEKPKSNGGDLNLFEAFGDDPTVAPKLPEKPKSNGGDLDLFDALGDDIPTKAPPKKNPAGGGGVDFNLEDAFGPDLNPKPNKPAVNPPKSGGGGGSFDDSDLEKIGGGDYKPDGGRSGGGVGGHSDAGHDAGAGEQPQEAGSGQIAGIASAIGMALLGAASSYFAYQKKKLCFKVQGGADPESGKYEQGNHADPQVLSNLLKTT